MMGRQGIGFHGFLDPRSEPKMLAAPSSLQQPDSIASVGCSLGMHPSTENTGVESQGNLSCSRENWWWW